MASTFVLKSSSYEGRYMELACTQTQDIAANKSTINWTLSSKGGEHTRYATGPTTVIINGQQVYYRARAWQIYAFPETVGSTSGTITVDHLSDGSKTIAVSMTTDIYDGVLDNYSGTWQLDNIPRQATITAASDFTDLDNPSISFSNPGGFTTDVWIELNPIGDHLCVRKGIPNTGTYTWSLTTAERDELRNHCAGTECTARLGLYTYIGNTTYADYKDKKFTIKESTATKPAVTLSTSLDNGNLYLAFDGLYIQGKSKVGVNLSAQGKYGASIESYSATIEGKTYSSNKFTSDVLQTSGSVKIVGSAKDSRKFTGSAEKTINVIPYSKPLVIPCDDENAILCYRSDGNGHRVGNSTSVWVKAKASYYDVAGMNSCALEWRCKLASEPWDDDQHIWWNLTEEGSYNDLIQGEEFDLNKSYTIQIRAADLIGEEDIKTFEIPTRDVALHLGKGGKNVSIGSYCDYSEERTFHSEWKAIFDEGVIISGSPVADHIVERGTGGVWTYEKLASGIARCWAKIDYTADLAGVGVRSYVRIGKGFPVTFKSLPFCNCTLANQTTWNHILSSVDFTESMVVAISVYRLGEGVNVTAGGTADIMVIGYWK